MISRMLFLVSLLGWFACVSSPGQSTVIRCHVDADCDDDQPNTVDRCGQAMGMCHHTTVTSTGCEANAECDDRLTQTQDTCLEGRCHHVSTSTMFDPASPDRQNATTLCESDVTCREPEDTPHASIYWLDRCEWNPTDDRIWNEDGYRLGINLMRRRGIRRLNVRLQMRVGDPNVRQHLKVYSQQRYFHPPIFEREVSVREIEQGFDFDINEGSGQEDAAGALLYLQILPLSQGSLRAYQWALPVDGVRDADTGQSLNRCLHVGRFMRVPQHGQLRLTVNEAQAAQCEGTPLALDEPNYPLTSFNGFVRSQTNAEVVYLVGLRQEIDTFQGLRGLADWLNPYSACSQVYILSDATFAELRRTWTTRQIGIRPGMMVSWTDAQGTVHRGITDRNFVIHDFSAYLSATGVRDHRQITNAGTSIYLTYRYVRDGREGRMSSLPDANILDIQPYIGFYRVAQGAVPYQAPLFYPTMIEAYFFPDP